MVDIHGGSPWLNRISFYGNLFPFLAIYLFILLPNWGGGHSDSSPYETPHLEPPLIDHHHLFFGLWNHLRGNVSVCFFAQIIAPRGSKINRKI